MVAPGAAFALSPCGWAAGGVVTHVLSTGWGAPASPWHKVLLKHPGAVPAGAEADLWHCAHTCAFDGSVSVWVYGAPRQGAGACGAP